MPLRELRDALPPYAADLRADLDALDHERDMSAEERWGCVLACAFAAGEPTTLRRVAEAAAEPLGGHAVAAAKAAAAITSLNDIYYGARGAVTNQEYATLPSGLSLETLRRPGVGPDVFDLWCFSVSALHGCGPCMDAQDGELRRRGVPAARMHAAMRIAAVVGAVSRVLAAEAILADDKDKGGDGPSKQEQTDMTEQQDTGAPAPGGDAPGEAGAPAAPAGAPHPVGTADPAVTGAPHPAPAPGDVSPG